MVQRYRYRNGASEEEIAAYNILREYEQMGYLAIEELNDLSDDSFYEYLETAPMEYLENVENAAKAMGYRGGFRTYNFGQEIEDYPWHLKYRYVESLIRYRNTDKGKKAILKKYGPKSIRNDENDTDDMLDTATLKAADVHTGDKKKDKKITQLNIQRLEIIKLLEQSIAKGGYIRQAYDDILEKYNRDVDDLPSDETVTKVMKSENRATAIKRGFFWVLVMPLYYVLYFLATIFDSLIAKRLLGEDLQSKTFKKYGPFGRYITSYLIVAIIEVIFLFLLYEPGKEMNYKFGDPISEVLIGGIIDTLYFCAIKIPIGIVIDKLLDLYTVIVENVEFFVDSHFFYVTHDDVKMAGVHTTLRYHEVLENEIQIRENAVNALKDAVRNNSEKCQADNFYNSKDATFTKKRLLKEASDKTFRFNY